MYGSKLVRSSPYLIAAYHVLHRLSVPRHPPNALKSLDHSHYCCPSCFAPLGKRYASLMNVIWKNLFDIHLVSSQHQAIFNCASFRICCFELTLSQLAQGAIHIQNPSFTMSNSNTCKHRSAHKNWFSGRPTNSVCS
jgi:hypothetical protein